MNNYEDMSETGAAGETDASTSIGDSDMSFPMKGRVNPGLLNVLADVASAARDSRKAPKQGVSPSVRRKAQNSCALSLSELDQLSGHLMVKLFSRYEADEMRRTFSYKCCLLPNVCNQVIASFNMESRARESMKLHLMNHVKELHDAASEGRLDPSTFRISPINSRPKKNEKNTDLAVGVPVTHPCSARKMEVKCHRQDAGLEQVPDDSTLLDAGEGLLSELFQTYMEKCQGIQELGDHSYFYGTKVHQQSGEMPTAEDHDDENYEDETKMRHHCKCWWKSIKGDRVQGRCKTRLPQAPIHRAMYLEPINVHGVFVKCRDLQSIDQPLPSVGGEMELQVEDSYPVMRSGDLPVVSLDQCDHLYPVRNKADTSRDSGDSEEKQQALMMLSKLKSAPPRGKGQSKYQCAICSPVKTFTALMSLMGHLRSHAGIKPFVCRICGSAFTRMHSLNYHMQIHENVSRFQCSECGRKFRHPAHFKEHLRRHTGESPFECSDCFLRFKTRNTYKRHMRTRHGKLLTPDGRIIIMPEEEYATLRDQSKVSSVERRKQESLEKKEVRIAMALQQEVVEVCPDLVPVMKEEKKGSRKKRVNRRSRIRSTPVLPVNVSPKESSISSENVIFVQDPEGGFSFDGTQTIIMCDEVVEPVPAKTSQTRENAMQEYQLISVSEHMGDGETIILEGVDMNQLGDCYEIPVEVVGEAWARLGVGTSA